jgi:outer membrane protein W
MRRLMSVPMVALLVVLGAPAMASAQQSVSFSIGSFTPRGSQISDGTLSGRTGGDVLTANSDFLAFNLRDFRNVTVNGEWLVGLGDKFEGGLGIGYYSRTVPSSYFDFVNSDGSEIEQDLSLRVVPFSATLRFLPLGHRDAFEPYIGAGVGVFSWRYSETGQFLATDNSIFRSSYTGKGSTTGPVILGGVRLPVSRSVGIGGEIRYQSADGNLPGDQGFAGTKIDLGGWTYAFTMNFRF